MTPSLRYHISSITLKCPYCDEKIADYFEVLYGVECRDKIECDKCGKRFWGEARYAYDSYSDCTLNDEGHEWYQPSEKHPTVFNCKNCAQYEVR